MAGFPQNRQKVVDLSSLSGDFETTEVISPSDVGCRVSGWTDFNPEVPWKPAVFGDISASKVQLPWDEFLCDDCVFFKKKQSLICWEAIFLRGLLSIVRYLQALKCQFF